MLPRNRGTIVQVGSTLAYRGIPLQSAYCGSKHAIQGFNESLRCELLHDGSAVRTTMVQMPAVNTPQFSWVLSRLPHQAQPVPPDLPARGRRPRRRVRRGPPRTPGVLGRRQHHGHPDRQRRRPGVLDRYLAKTGFSSQQTGRPEAPGPAGEPLGARRRTAGPRLRRARRSSTTAPTADPPSSGPPSTTVPWRLPGLALAAGAAALAGRRRDR